jgi:hypothetical protein
MPLTGKGQHTNPATEFKKGHANLHLPGNKWTPAQRANQSKRQLGKKNPDHSERIKALWKTPGYADKQHLGRSILPNKSERNLNALLGLLFPGEYLFTGDFSFMVDGKNPDFISTDGSKRIIELFGDRYHKKEEAESRIAFFGAQGFSALVIWEVELKDLPILIEKLRRFQAGG